MKLIDINIIFEEIIKLRLEKFNSLYKFVRLGLAYFLAIHWFACYWYYWFILCLLVDIKLERIMNYHGFLKIKFLKKVKCLIIWHHLFGSYRISQTLEIKILSITKLISFFKFYRTTNNEELYFQCITMIVGTLLYVYIFFSLGFLFRKRFET